MSTAFPQPFGKYTLLSKLGVGGMAITYRGRETLPGGATREVAVKCMLPHLLNNQTFVQLFIDEARTAVKLQHPNIAAITDFGSVEGQLYLAMEFVDGPSLAQVLERSKLLGAQGLPIPETLWVGCLICEALNYAHTQAGIVHRDVSPQNLLLGYDGKLKLIDFGIATALSKAAAGKGGQVSGKYRYASPEQARGEPVDQRTDVYATGVVLYELLTGQRPYDGGQLQVMALSKEGEFPLASSHREAVQPLDGVLMRALAPRVANRFADAKALLQRLYEQLLEFEPAFDPGDLKDFMSFLYEKELAAETG